jgi:hypothetical protein
MNSREPLIANAQLSSQTEAVRKITNTLLEARHAPYKKRIFGECSMLQLG